jgi:uncharacterized MAPEG superfamily protein
MLNGFAVAFVVLRIVYVLMYLTDRPSLRSAAWWIGFFCNLAIFLLPAWAKG